MLEELRELKKQLDRERTKNITRLNRCKTLRTLLAMSRESMDHAIRELDIILEKLECE